MIINLKIDFPHDLYYDFLVSNHLTCLFAVWSLTIAGYVYLLGQIDRYSYWDWNGFYEGAIKLIISTVLFYVFVRANLLKQEKNRLSYIDIIFNSGYYFSFFIIGTIRIDSADISLSGYLPYFSFILAAIFFYEYKNIDSALQKIEEAKNLKLKHSKALLYNENWSKILEYI